MLNVKGSTEDITYRGLESVSSWWRYMKMKGQWGTWVGKKFGFGMFSWLSVRI